MMKKILSLTLLYFLTGCAPISEVTKLSTLETNTNAGLGKDTITYSDNLRCFVRSRDEVIMRKGVEIKRNNIYKDWPILSNNGQKVRSKEEVDDLITSGTELKWTTNDKIYFGVTAVWLLPVGLFFNIAEAIMGIPSAPFVFHMNNKL